MYCCSSTYTHLKRVAPCLSLSTLACRNQRAAADGELPLFHFDQRLAPASIAWCQCVNQSRFMFYPASSALRVSENPRCLLVMYFVHTVAARTSTGRQQHVPHHRSQATQEEHMSQQSVAWLTTTGIGTDHYSYYQISCWVVVRSSFNFGVCITNRRGK